MQSLAYRARGAAILAVLLLMAACGPLPPVASFPGAGAAPSAERAEAASRSGDHAAAAAMYEALAAAATGTAPAGLQLLAIREWLSANRASDATRVLGNIRGTLSAEQQNERRILAAEVALANNQPQGAWEQLAAITDSLTMNSAPYLEARMRAALATARPG